MLTTVILVGSLLLAVGFTVAWLVNPGFRQKIERPKHLFTDQVRQYDERNRETDRKPGAE